MYSKITFLPLAVVLFINSFTLSAEDFFYPRNTAVRYQKHDESAQTELAEEKIIIEESSLILEKDFYITEISDSLFSKMWKKSFKENCTIPRSELRYLHVLHKTLDGSEKEGELVCNAKIAEVLLGIFKDLYVANYPIEKIRLIDEYDADDEKSMSDNNSSCFNFRFISHTTVVSKHGLGLAVDINPLYNPYYKMVNGKPNVEPANSTPYLDRSKNFPYKIDHEDLAYKLFTSRGFEWGGDWNTAKDWQHFEIRD